MSVFYSKGHPVKDDPTPSNVLPALLLRFQHDMLHACCIARDGNIIHHEKYSNFSHSEKVKYEHANAVLQAIQFNIHQVFSPNDNAQRQCLESWTAHYMAGLIITIKFNYHVILANPEIPITH